MNPRTDHRATLASSRHEFSVVALEPHGPSDLVPTFTSAGFEHVGRLASWAEAIQAAEALSRAGHVVEVRMSVIETTTTVTAVSVHRPAEKRNTAQTHG